MLSATPTKKTPGKQARATAKDTPDSAARRSRVIHADAKIRRQAENILNKKRSGSPVKKAAFSARSHRASVSRQLDLLPAEPLLESASVIDVANHMAAKRQDAILLVNAQGSITGIVTDKDLAYRVVTAKLNPRGMAVSAIMTPSPKCVTGTASITTAMGIMVENHFRHLPVIDEKRATPEGILDMTKCLYDMLQKLQVADSAAKKVASAMADVGEEFGSGSVFGGQEGSFLSSLQDRLACPTLEAILEAKSDRTPIIDMKASVYDACKLMKEYKQTAILVVDAKQRLLGIFTTKDVVLRVIAANLDPTTTTVVRVMTPQPDHAEPTMTIVDALKKMHEGHYLHLPVLDAEKAIVGLVDVLDVTYFTLEQINTMQGSQENGGPVWDKFWGGASAASLSEAAEERSERSDRLSLMDAHGAAAMPSPLRLSQAIDPDRTFMYKIRGTTGAVYLKLLGCDLSMLIKAIADRFNIPATQNITLAYTDDEEDQIFLTSSQDLYNAQAMIKEKGKMTLHIFLDGVAFMPEAEGSICASPVLATSSKGSVGTFLGTLAMIALVGGIFGAYHFKMMNK